MIRRRRARGVALQVLYQVDLNPGGDPAVIESFLRGRLRSDDLVEFARSLVNGVRRNRGELDCQLEEIAENWSLPRMAAIDRNILRLGACEILYTNVPARAVINEALELAKRFGSAQSSRFVNGIFDRVLASHRSE